MTAAEAVTRALWRLGVYDGGQTPHDVDLTLGLRDLNDWLQEWPTAGLESYMPPSAPLVAADAINIPITLDTALVAGLAVRLSDYFGPRRLTPNIMRDAARGQSAICAHYWADTPSQSDIPRTSHETLYRRLFSDEG